MAVNSPRAVIVDIDNTVYPYQVCHEAGLIRAGTLAAALDRYWVDISEFNRDYDNARRVVKRLTGVQAAGHSRLLYLKHLVEARWGRTDIEAVLKLHRAYWEGYHAEMVPDPGCAECLEDLRVRGVRLAWVTNFTTERQLMKLRDLGLESAADFLITSEEVSAEKPDPAPLDLALRKLRSRPEETWVIGDSLTDDIAAAQTLNLTSVWFNRDGAEQSGPVPDFIVRNWLELREVLHR